MKAKKNVALVFGITSNYTFALANALIGLKKHNNKFWDDIIVYYDMMSDEEIKCLNSIVKCKFICAKELEFASKLPKEAVEKYSIAAFYRYECFNLLNDYKKVIWNDVDILIQGDISGLLNYANDSGFAATLTTGGFNVEANFKELIYEYNMFTKLYNSGILVLSDSLKNYERAYDWLIEKTNKYANILRWPDQGILNIFIQEFDINVENIDIEKYCCHPSLKDKCNVASIIHAYGDAKFWNSRELRIQFPEWEKNDIEWKQLAEQTGLVLTNREPLVSCIMSTYNRYDYLKESINSILEQTYNNFELIVVLEKCENQNKIENILKSFNDKRIIIVKNKEKLGFPASLNVALDMAKGKYIARMDDDDISLPTRFKKQVEFMEKHPNYGICGTNAVFFGKYNTEIGVEIDSDKLKIITLFRTPLIHPTVMMRKELMDEYNLRYDSNYFTEDYELWSRAVKFFPIGNLSEILLKYRASNDNLTSGNNEKKIHNSHKQIMKNQFKNYLNLDMTENEIELMQGRLDVFSVCFNKESAIKFKKSVQEKIIEANKEVKFYNTDKLNAEMNYINNVTTEKQPLIRRTIKRVLRPFYNSFIIRVNRLIDERSSQMYNYFDRRIEEIKNEIKK